MTSDIGKELGNYYKMQQQMIYMPIYATKKDVLQLVTNDIGKNWKNAIRCMGPLRGK